MQEIIDSAEQPVDKKRLRTQRNWKYISMGLVLLSLLTFMLMKWDINSRSDIYIGDFVVYLAAIAIISMIGMVATQLMRKYFTYFILLIMHTAGLFMTSYEIYVIVNLTGESFMDLLF